MLRIGDDLGSIVLPDRSHPLTDSIMIRVFSLSPNFLISLCIYFVANWPEQQQLIVLLQLPVFSTPKYYQVQFQIQRL